MKSLYFHSPITIKLQLYVSINYYFEIQIIYWMLKRKKKEFSLFHQPLIFYTLLWSAFHLLSNNISITPEIPPGFKRKSSIRKYSSVERKGIGPKRKQKFREMFYFLMTGRKISTSSRFQWLSSLYNVSQFYFRKFFTNYSHDSENTFLYSVRQGLKYEAIKLRQVILLYYIWSQ